MKILTTTKTLAVYLNKIDFEQNSVCEVELDGEVFSLILDSGKRISFGVSVIIGKDHQHQEDRRWDWVKHTMNQVDEQPVVLHIFDNIIDVIFQY